jgi:nucleoside-diphosphate-sugar epimerase
LTTTRDFTFVEDTCRGFLALGTLDGRSGEIFHIGSNVQVSVGDLLGMIALIMGSPVQVKEDAERLRPRKSEVARLQCDNTKLLDATGFRPSVPAEEGLRRTCEWFSCPENLKRFKGDIYNV